MKPAIAIEGLSKRYQLGRAKAQEYQTLRESLAGAGRAAWRRAGRLLGRGNGRDEAASNGASGDTLWALKDVSFEVQPGEVIGIIGRNGAGKSTLLKVLSRITEPTEGRVSIRGRVASLLEVGTGFHHELTGRENIFLNGSVLGLKRREIAARFQRIVDFAEIGPFLDTPVKRYSSGMFVRLAFAVAAHLEPDVLVVDEVLAVGDTSFQKRCLRRMDEVSQDGRTVLFVSHNLAVVRSLCRSALIMQQGRLISTGSANEQVARYVAELSSAQDTTLERRTDREGDGTARFTYVRFQDDRGNEVDNAFVGSPVRIVIGYNAKNPSGEPVTLAISIWSPDGTKVVHLDNTLRAEVLAPLARAGEYGCWLDRLPLPPAQYQINASLRVGGRLADHVHAAARLTILPGDFFGTGRPTPNAGAAVFVAHRWG